MACSESKRILCGEFDCHICFPRSFAYHCEKALYWSDKNKINSLQVFKSAGKSFWFKCPDCDHEFESMIANVYKGKFCPFENGKKLCDGKNCTMCFNNSFASHPISEFWSDKNDITPRKVFKSSGVKYIFDCNVCGHDYKIIPRNISRSQSNCCPYCAHKRLCNNSNCQFCFNNSFASHPKSKYWSDENECKPRDVFLTSNTKYKFNCKVCNNIYISALSNVVQGCWCTCRRNKTETKLHKWLVKNGFDVECQPEYDWCVNPSTNKYLPFDFTLEDYKVIIELDGNQHLVDVKYWKTKAKDVQKMDAYKMKQALKNGYTIIRLLQKDVWNNRINWEKLLKQSIGCYKNPKCIFLSNNGEYKCFDNIFRKKSKTLTKSDLIKKKNKKILDLD